jgi:fructose-bisphosphate aldolase class II
MLDADEAHFKATGEPLFSSHMIDLSEEEVDWNVKTTAAYLKRAAPMKQWLEMEIGITGGEEDGVNNEDVDNNSLYTQPEDILNIYNTLSPISPYFSIAAGFGNVHGVYKPGNVKLHPELLGKHQAHVKAAIKSDNDKPVFFVFHGGSGSGKQEYLDAISHGVVKVNMDTDMQFAYMSGIRDYMLNKKDYLLKAVGNPEGEDKPNKKYFDVSAQLTTPYHYFLRLLTSLTSPVSGSARVRRPWPPVSPRPSRTSTPPTRSRFTSYDPCWGNKAPTSSAIRLPPCQFYTY